MTDIYMLIKQIQQEQINPMSEMPSEPYVFEVDLDHTGKRLDVYLVEMSPQYSRSYLSKMVAGGNVLVNGVVPRKRGQILENGDNVSLTIIPIDDHLSSPKPEQMDLKLVLDDDEILVIDKPTGLTVHPGFGHIGGTLVNGVLGLGYDLPNISGVTRPGIVHRLDKDTSGLIILSKTEHSYKYMIKQFKERAVRKTYFAIIKGNLSSSKGVIDAPIGRNPNNRQKMAIVNGGKEAITEFEVLFYLGNYTFVKVHPITGRSHQIRVHFSSLGHPILGDRTYGRDNVNRSSRLFLHAKQLVFNHPASKELITVSSELPNEFEELIEETIEKKDYLQLIN